MAVTQASTGMIDSSAGAGSQKASGSAWLAVAAGAIGSFMATLDISIVNAALPTIQGEIGASASEGTWVATSYLVAEIVVIPLAAWFERMLGLRRFLLIAAVLFTIFSVLCGTADSLGVMIIGRIGQGFTGGAMIPTAMSIIAMRLPPAQQPIGTSIFGGTVILGPILGPLVGGWLTETFSWHYAFFLNVPICAVLIVLLIVGLPGRRMDLGELFEADWAGVAGLALGLGALTVLLEEGHREHWFESSYIVKLAFVSFAGFLLLAWGQFLARRPVIKLALLHNRAFAAVMLLSLVVGVILYGVSYVVPQFVAAIAGYNALQAGQIIVLSGLPALVVLPLLPVAVKFVDLRVAIGVGLLLMALGCYLVTDLTAASSGSDFVASQLIIGAGQVMAMIFLNQAAISSVSATDAGDASGLFNAARNLGGSIGLAVLATLQDKNWGVHRWEIHSVLSTTDPQVQASIRQSAAGYGGGSGGLEAAYRAVDGMIQRDSLVMAFNDNFFVLALTCAAVLPLVLLLRPLPKNFEMAMH